MQLRNSSTHYGQIARLLHWTSVATLLGVVIHGNTLGGLAEGAERARVVADHVSLGVVLLVLMTARFWWRQLNANPVLSYSIRPWQKRAAVSVHWFLYAAVLLQCAIGLVQAIVGDAGLTVFGLALTSPAPAPNVLADRLAGVHLALSNAIYAAVTLHVLAATYHQVFGVLDRPPAGSERG